MRVNVYAEEMTDRVVIISKEIDGHVYTGVRFYLELPATVNGQQHRGPFMHREGDDDSSAVTFWGKRDLLAVLEKALALLNSKDVAPSVGSRSDVNRAISDADGASSLRETAPRPLGTSESSGDDPGVGTQRLNSKEGA